MKSIKPGLFLILSITLATGSQVYGQSFLTNGLVAYYPFNGNPNDASGNGHDGTNFSGALATDRFGIPNACYAFDGTSSHMECLDRLR